MRLTTTVVALRSIWFSSARRRLSPWWSMASAIVAYASAACPNANAAASGTASGSVPPNEKPKIVGSSLSPPAMELCTDASACETPFSPSAAWAEISKGFRCSPAKRLRHHR